MIYALIFVLLALFLLGYIKWAERAGVIDRPNERSSHSRPTIRGGGVIFPAAILLWGLFFHHIHWPFIAAVLIAGAVGFFDDRYSLSQWVRLAVQSVAVGLVMWQVGILQFPIIWMLVAFILITGWLNAFNFMDGINGITAFYSLSVIGGLFLFLPYIGAGITPAIYVTVIALLIFSFFNARKKAVVFAGDVGSLSMGIILAYLISVLIVESGRWEFIILVAVYGVDTVLTILQRLLKKENIFEAHRSHLYQYLANEMKWNHLAVSALYAIIQIAISTGLYLMDPSYRMIYAICSLTGLTLVYIFVKGVVLRRVGI